MRTSYLNSRPTVFVDDKKIETYIDIFNTKDKISVSAPKYNQILEDMKELERGQVILSKAFKEKPSKKLQWIKSDEKIVLELWHSTPDNNWDFQSEFVVTMESIELFTPTYEYCTRIMKSLKKELSDEALADTTFSTRE
jgi:hypothetical protein